MKCLLHKEARDVIRCKKRADSILSWFSITNSFDFMPPYHDVMILLQNIFVLGDFTVRKQSLLEELI